jgi:zinc protease
MPHRHSLSIMIFLILCSGLLLALFLLKNNRLPDNPSRISYKPLDWKVPVGAPYRHVLPSGLVAYIAEDRTLPLVSISGYIKYGDLKDPEGKEGLCSLLAALLRTGGTKKYQSDSLDAIIDLYAFNVKIAPGETQLRFSFSCLNEYLGLCLDVMQQMLFYPAFEEKKVKKSMDLFIEDLYHRFDNPGPILNAAYEKAMYAGGANSRMPTVKSIRNITREDLLRAHQKAVRADNIIFAVSGKFSSDSMVKRLSVLFPKAGRESLDSSFLRVALRAPEKILFVKKAATQSYVKLGLRLFQRPNPDYYAVSVLNMILGGESFTSRLGTKIRSDEGLTYSIYSNAESNYFYPGTFYVEFHTKTESTCRALSLSLAEVQRLKTSGITNDELDHAKKILIDGFPSMFRSPEDIVENYSMNEYFKRPADHYVAYPKKIASLTNEDIRKAAQKYLDPSNFTYTIVGDSAAVFKTDTIAGFSLHSLKPSRFIEPDSIPALP